MSKNTDKKMISFRLCTNDIEKLDYMSKELSKETKIDFDRTMTIEYCIHWEYDRKYNTNKVNEYIDSIK